MTDLPDSSPHSLRNVAAALRLARETGQKADSASLASSVSTDEAVLAVLQDMAHYDGWKSAGGVAPLFWKSGGPQRGEPLKHSPLPPAGVCSSPAELTHWPVFHLHGIEAEIALRIGKDVDSATAQGIMHGNLAPFVDAMCVSIELVDSRWDAGLQSPSLMQQADYQNHSGLVLGKWVPYESRNWAEQTGHVDTAGKERVHFRGGHALGDPAWLVPQWLRFITRHWGIAQAGTVVTTGKWCGILHASAGSTTRVVFDGIGEASVSW